MLDTYQSLLFRLNLNVHSLDLRILVIHIVMCSLSSHQVWEGAQPKGYINKIKFNYVCSLYFYIFLFHDVV